MTPPFTRARAGRRAEERQEPDRGADEQVIPGIPISSKPNRTGPLHPSGPACPTARGKEEILKTMKITGNPIPGRGGQPGNANALKHGFYSNRFNTLELSDLDTALSDGLDDEISLLRVIIRRVFEYADTEAQDLETWSKALSTLGAASTRLGGLLRTQQLISGGSTDVVSILSNAIGEVAHDLGLQ